MFNQQAQDRAHRIGQTREVHIYRLVSDKTIEENILRKARQRRQLDFLAITAGKYVLRSELIQSKWPLSCQCRYTSFITPVTHPLLSPPRFTTEQMFSQESLREMLDPDGKIAVAPPPEMSAKDVQEAMNAMEVGSNIRMPT